MPAAASDLPRTRMSSVEPAGAARLSPGTGGRAKARPTTLASIARPSCTRLTLASEQPLRIRYSCTVRIFPHSTTATAAVLCSTKVARCRCSRSAGHTPERPGPVLRLYPPLHHTAAQWREVFAWREASEPPHLMLSVYDRFRPRRSVAQTVAPRRMQIGVRLKCIAPTRHDRSGGQSVDAALQSELRDARQRDFRHRQVPSIHRMTGR
jgi:hypothetical protein